MKKSALLAACLSITLSPAIFAAPCCDAMVGSFISCDTEVAEGLSQSKTVVFHSDGTFEAFQSSGLEGLDTVDVGGVSTTYGNWECIGNNRIQAVGLDYAVSPDVANNNRISFTEIDFYLIFASLVNDNVIKYTEELFSVPRDVCVKDLFDTDFDFSQATFHRDPVTFKIRRIPTTINVINRPVPAPI